MKINSKLLSTSGNGVRNSTFTSGTCKYYKMGKVVCVHISDLWGNSSAYSGNMFTGLPKPIVQPVFMLYSYSTFSQARVRVDSNGIVTSHYSTMEATNSGKQFYGIAVYETND